MTHPLSPRRSAQSGVMLLEVLIALVIFMIGALGLMGYVGRSLGDSVDAKMRTQAAMLAQQYYARLDGVITTAARGADLTTYGTAVNAAAPTICAAWTADTLNSTSVGLPNASATCQVITTAESIHVRLTITWQARSISGGDVSTAPTHQFVTQKPIV